MLSLSLAARQRCLCLQASISRAAARASSSSSGETFYPANRRPVLLRPSSLALGFPGLANSSAIATRPFSTSSVSRSEDHVFEWKVHRLLSIAQIPMFIVPFIWTNPVTDAIFCTLLVVHSHWGLEAIAVDYVQPVRVGGSTLIPKLAVGAVWALSAFTLGALYYFNYTDVGIVHAIKMLWSL